VKCQRARIVNKENEPVNLTDPSWIGRELWVIAEPPQWYPVLSKDGINCKVLGVRLPYNSKPHWPPCVMPASFIELLARGPEDFCEVDTLMPWGTWVNEQEPPFTESYVSRGTLH
jgi:hypothetical protein